METSGVELGRIVAFVNRRPWLMEGDNHGHSSGGESPGGSSNYFLDQLGISDFGDSSLHRIWISSFLLRVLQFASLLFLGHWPISFFSAHTSLAQVGREARKRAPCNHSALSYFEPSYSPKQKYHDFFHVFSYLRRLNPLSNDKIGQLIHPKLLGFIWMT